MCCLSTSHASPEQPHSPTQHESGVQPRHQPWEQPWHKSRQGLCTSRWVLPDLQPFTHHHPFTMLPNNPTPLLPPRCWGATGLLCYFLEHSLVCVLFLRTSLNQPLGKCCWRAVGGTWTSATSNYLLDEFNEKLASLFLSKCFLLLGT